MRLPRTVYGEKPKAIRDQDVVQQFTQFGIRGGGVILPNNSEDCGVRIAFVSHQIAQNLKPGKQIPQR